MDCALWEKNESLPHGKLRPRGGTVPGAAVSPLGARVCTRGCSAGSPRDHRSPLRDPSPDLLHETPVVGGVQWVLAKQQQFGDCLSPLCWMGPASSLPVGVLPPPVGQHKVRMAEDGGKPEGLRDLPEGDGEISGQDLKGTKHRRRRGRCQAGERCPGQAGGVTLLLQPQERGFAPMG